MDYKDATQEFVSKDSTTVPVHQLFSEARGEETINKNIENFFVHTFIGNEVGAMSTYLTDSYQWDGDEESGTPLKNFTLVKLDNGSYLGKILLLATPEGELVELVRVQIIDNDVLYVNPAGNGPVFVDPSIETGNYYWIKVENLFSVNPQNSFIQTIFQERFFGSEEAAKMFEEKSKVDSSRSDIVEWNRNPPNTIFRSKDGSLIYVVIDTGRQEINKMSDLEQIDFEAMEAARDQIAKKYKFLLKTEANEQLTYAFKVVDKIVENRPNSTLKYLLSVPVSVIEPLIKEKETNYDKLIKYRSTDFLFNVQLVAAFLGELNPKVKESNIPLDLEVEKNRLLAAGNSIINYLNKHYNNILEIKQYDIVLTYNYESKLAALYLEDSEGRLAPPEDLKQGVFVDEDWHSKDFFKKRTFHYLVNLDAMSRSMQDVGLVSRGLPWLTFLKMYTLDMPAHKISQKENPPTREKLAEQELAKAREELGGVTTNEHLSRVLRRISPEIRALTYEAKKNMFKKLQDSNMKNITKRGFAVYDVDSLFTDVLDRVSIDTIINTIKLAQNPEIAKGHFREKFVAFDISSQIKKIENTKKLFQQQAEAQRKSSKTNKVAYEDNTEIKSVAKKAAIEAIDHLSAMAQEALIQTVKNLLQSLLDSIREENEKDKTQEFGTLDIEENISPTDLITAMDSVNSIKGIDFEIPDLKIILKIVSDNTTPMEMIALFEGQGNMVVIQLLNRLLKKRFPLLENLLPTLYDVEDFLIALGKDLLIKINNAAAQAKIDKIENKSPLDYCSTDEEIILDFLSERFPEILSKEQIAKSEESKTVLLDTLEDLQNTIDGLSGLLGNDSIDAVLDSIQDNPATKYNMGQVVEAYFNPITKMFVFEALNAGSSLTEFISVPHPNFNQDELDGLIVDKTQEQTNDIVSQYLATRPPSTEEKLILSLREMQNILKNPSYWTHASTFSALKQDWDEVNDIYTDKYIITLPLLFMEQIPGIMPDLDSYMEIKFFGMKPPPTYEQVEKLFSGGKSKNELEKEAAKGAAPQAVKEQTINATLQEMLKEHENNYRNVKTRFKVVLNNVTLLETENTINTIALEDPKINMGDLIKPDDFGRLPQGSAFGTWIDGVFKKYNAKYTNEDNVPAFSVETLPNKGGGIDKYDDFLNKTFKDWLFRYSSNHILNRILIQISKSEFFDVEVMKKLKLTAPSDYFISASGKKISSQSINELVRPDLIKKQVADKEKLFRYYEKNTNDVLFDRTPLENAITMQAVELFVRIYMIEYLMSTVVVQGEINIDKINQRMNNLEPIVGLMIENIKSFGKPTEFLMTNVLTQYSSFRQEFSGRSNKVKPLPESFNVYEDDLQGILSVLIGEQYKEIQNDFGVIVNLFNPTTSDVKVKAKEFLDIIPNIDVAESSASSKNRLLNPIDDLLKETVKSGGFMIERYIRIEGPPKENGNTNGEIKLHEFMVQDPLKSHIMLFEDVANPGRYLPIKKSEVWNKPDVLKSLRYNQLWFDTYNDKYQQYSADWAATKGKPEAQQLVISEWESWKEDYLEDYQDGDLAPGYDNYLKNAVPTAEHDFYYDEGNLIGVVRRSSFKKLTDKVKYYNASVLFPLQASLNTANDFKYELDALRGIKEDAYAEYLKAAMLVSEWFKKYTLKFKEPFDVSAFSGFSISASEKYVFDNDQIWLGENSAIVQENLFKVNTFFTLFDSQANINSDGFDLINMAMASWTMDVYVSDIEDVYPKMKPGDEKPPPPKINWRPKAPAKMINVLTTQEAWDSFLKFLLNYKDSTSLRPFVQTFQVLIDPAGANPELLDLISGQTVTTHDSDNSLIEDHNEYNFTIQELGQQQLISKSGYNNLPYYKAIEDLVELKEAMYSGITTLTDLTVQYDEYDPETGNKTGDSSAVNQKAQARIDDWKKRTYYHDIPTVKSGEVEYTDLNFHNIKTKFYNAYDAYIEASKNYTEAYYKFKSSPMGYKAYGFNAKEVLETIISGYTSAITGAPVILSPYTKYIGSIKYGMRLVYKMPQEVGVNNSMIDGHYLNPFSKRAADYTHPSNYFGKAFKMKEFDIEQGQYIDDIQKYMSNLWDNPFIGLDDSRGFITPKKAQFLTIPLIEVEEEVKEYFSKNNLPVITEDGVEPAPGMNESILKNFPVEYLKNKMKDSHEYKVLISEIMLHEQLTTLAGAWVSTYAMKSTFSGANSGIFSGTKEYVNGALRGLAVQREIEHSNAEKTPTQIAKDNYASVSNTKMETESDFGPLKDFIGYAAIFAAKFPFKVLKGHVLASDPAIITAKKIQDAIVAAMQAGAAVVNTAAGLAGEKGPDLSGAIDAASSNSALVPITIGLTPFPIGLNFATPITPAGMAFLGTAGIQDALDSL